MLSLVSLGKWTIAASISQTISLTGIFDGVGANFGPFSRMELSIFKPTLFVRSLATIVRGTTSVKRGDVFQPEKKNISEMSRAALKDLTSQIMLGRTIIQLTLNLVTLRF